MREKTMSKARHRDDEMLKEYDFSNGVRGKYAERYAEGTNIVVLAPDVASVFHDSESVNRALRLLIEAAQQTVSHRPDEQAK
jgi:hypothetical protein